MSRTTALSISIAVLGGIWAYLALGPVHNFALVWAGFIAWGCFFQTGGDANALAKTIAGTIYGAFLAWIALMIITNAPLPALGVVWPAIVVGVTVFFLVIVAPVELLSAVPANVYGYAALVGYTLSKGATADLTAASFANPLALMAFSFIVGALFGYASAQLTGMLAAKKA